MAAYYSCEQHTTIDLFCDAFCVVASSQVIGFCYDLIGIDRMRLNKLNFTKNDLNNLDKITVVAF